MTLDYVMSRVRDALMTEYLFIEVPPYCAVPDFDVLKRTPSILRGRYPARMEELQGRAGQAVPPDARR